MLSRIRTWCVLGCLLMNIAGIDAHPLPNKVTSRQIISWQTMTSFGAKALTYSSQYKVNTLILEFEPNAEQPGRQWNTLLDDLSFDDFAPLVAKRGVARQNVQKLRNNIGALTRAAKRQGVDVYIVVTELSFPPDMLRLYPQAKDLHSGFVWKFLESRLSSVLQALPDLAGIVLYTDEPSDFTVYQAQGIDHRAALGHLLTLYHNVSHRYGRRFVVTTFLDYDPKKMGVMLSALNQIPPAEDFIVDNYICPGDWGLVKLTNPAISGVKQHQQFLSFDYAGELWGQGNLPLCQATLMYDRLAAARSSGAHIVGINGYVSWYTQSIFGKPSEINLDFASEFLNDPALQPNVAVYNWLRKRYGAPAAKRLTPAFMSSWQVAQQSIQTLGLYISEAPKSAFPPPAWISYSVRTESLAAWDPKYAPLEESFARPDLKFLTKVIQEKDHAVESATAGLDAVEQARPFLKSGDYQLLRKQFTLSLYVARAYRIYLELFLRFRIWDQSGRGQIPQQVQVLQASLSTLINQMQAAVGSPPVFCPASLSDSHVRLEHYLQGEPFPNYWNSSKTPWTMKYPEAPWTICAFQDGYDSTEY